MAYNFNYHSLRQTITDLWFMAPLCKSALYNLISCSLFFFSACFFKEIVKLLNYFFPQHDVRKADFKIKNMPIIEGIFSSHYI